MPSRAFPATPPYVRFAYTAVRSVMQSNTRESARTCRGFGQMDAESASAHTGYGFESQPPTCLSFRSGLHSPFRVDLSVCSAFRHWSASIVSPTARTTMPSADFCATFGEPSDSPSPPYANRAQISRGNSDQLLCPSSELRRTLRWNTTGLRHAGAARPT